jgi:hypothetical protein
MIRAGAVGQVRRLRDEALAVGEPEMGSGFRRGKWSNFDADL